MATTHHTTHDETNPYRRLAFWGVVGLMIVVGLVQTKFLHDSLNQNEITELRYSQAIAGSQQGLFSWHVPANPDDWMDSSFWAGPNFYRVLRTANDKWKPTVGNLMEHVHEADRDRVWAAIEYAVNTTGKFDVDFQVQAGNKYIWVASHGEMGSLDGKPTLSGSIMNIDARMAERLRSDMIVNSAPVAIIMCGPSRKITVYNDAAEKLFGWPRADMIDNSIDRLVEADYLAHHGEVFANAAQRLMAADGDTTSGRAGVEGVAVNKAGERIPILLDLRGIKYRGKIEIIAVIRPKHIPIPIDLEPKPLRSPDAIEMKAR